MRISGGGSDMVCRMLLGGGGSILLRTQWLHVCVQSNARVISGL